MSENESPFKDSKAVSEASLACFDVVCAEVEVEVAKICMAEDDPQSTMGADAEPMIRNGLGFVTRMLRSAMVFAAGGILENEMEWAKTRLPVYGVSAKMVMDNLKRYSHALERKIPDQAFMEIKPYLNGMMIMQQRMTNI